ncbi:MAG: UDP-N-acetylmuramoyl-L-alanine--D-glutamate ligase, partial [Clostridia bacterium]|nr:UDP-N-acetylmuramoyl-L-alanine--D-glutamate ligase [Clostridia bacterium]
IGWGISGKGASKLLLSQGANVSVYSDEPIDLTGYPQVKDVSKLEFFDIIDGKDLVVISPSISQEHPLVEYAKRYSLPVIGEIELGYRFCKGKIVAVTGTNGKTTTTKLIGDILNSSGRKAYALGNIGKSFCESVEKINADEIAVLEVSSFQLESIKEFRPYIAGCLNVTPDHFERHKNIGNYALAKFNVFINQKAEDCAILNYDDEITKNFSNMISSNTFYTSVRHKVKGAFLREEKIYLNIDSEYEFMSVEDIPLKGDYNYQNVMTAILTCRLLGVESKDIISAIKNFQPPRYRNQFIGNRFGKNFFNDSKATNIDSTIKACKSMSGETTLIVGGYDKGIAYDGFFSSLPDTIRHIIATGDNVYSIMQFLPSYHEYTFEITSSLERATELAVSKDVKNILFSPTTSSFDRYSSYVERGEHFDMIVDSLRENGSGE